MWCGFTLAGTALAGMALFTVGAMRVYYNLSLAIRSTHVRFH